MLRKALFLEKISGNFCIKLQYQQNLSATVYKLHLCMYVQIQPVMVDTTLDHIFAWQAALCPVVGCFVFLIVLNSSDVYRIFQSQSLFSYDVSDTYGNGYHGACKCDIS